MVWLPGVLKNIKLEWDDLTYNLVNVFTGWIYYVV